MSVAKRAFQVILACILINGLTPWLSGVSAAPGTPNNIIFVDTLADEYDATPNGYCSLREAITAADSDAEVGGCATGSSSESDVIMFVVDGTFLLTRSGSDNTNVLGDLDIHSPVAIIGNGSKNTVISGNNLDRIFDVAGAGEVILSGMTITGGHAVDEGGGIRNFNSSLMINNVVIRENTSEEWGGGISDTVLSLLFSPRSNNARESVLASFPSGLKLENVIIEDNTADYCAGLASTESLYLSVINSSVIGNQAEDSGGICLLKDVLAVPGYYWIDRSQIKDNRALYGSAGGIYIYLAGDGVSITDSVIADNQAAMDGGNIVNAYGESTLTLIRDEISGGISGGNGGGIANFHGQVHVKSTTISNNHASGLGGGIFNHGGGGHIYNTVSTIAFNTADMDPGIGIYNELYNGTDSGEIYVVASIIAWNRNDSGLDANCFRVGPGGGESGYNIDSGETCEFDPADSLDNTDPRLLPLALNNAPNNSRTNALSALSPAIDWFDPGYFDFCGASETDGRGLPRAMDGDGDGTARCDVGAYERPVSHAYLFPLVLNHYKLQGSHTYRFPLVFKQ